MPSATELVLCLAVVALAAWQTVTARRLARTRRRARRSMLIGPESHLRLQKQIFDRLAALECRERGITPRLPLEFRSEWGEDILIFELFWPQTSGVYIEAGALDGRRNSVTWVFEALGWTGLLVEAIPERAAECQAARPDSVVVHAALGPRSASGTTSFFVPDDAEHQLSAYREHEGMQQEHLRALKKARATLRRVEVPFTSLSALLDAAGIKRVDFASIDVEGAELDVLRGFDLDRFRPRVLVVEDLTLGDDRAVSAHLAGAGYRHVMWIGENRVFIRADDPDLLERARRLTETAYSPFVRQPGQSDTAPRSLR
jgi:FkbM family methyltransferase